MKVPFLDLKVQYQSIKHEILPALESVCENTSFVMGKHVFDFEKQFAEKHGVKHCVAVSSGTDGNHLALWAEGIRRGDEVIIPANTFIATAWGATLCGATPVFVDCHPESYNLDPAKVEAAITSKTKAIVAVHLYGQPADLDPLRKIADKHNILLVEDAAQAHNAEYKGKKIGGLAKSASFSFYPGKNLGAYGEGGAVTTNDDTLAEKCRMIRDHGASKKYYHQMYGHNYRMEGFQGSVLGVKLKYLDQWTEGRRRAAKKYYEELRDIPEIIVPKEMDYAKHVYHLFVIQVKPQTTLSTETRDQLQAFLGQNEIASGLHYPVPLHQQECFAGLGYKKGDFPVTEALAEHGLSLPMFPELSDEQISFIASKIKEFFKK
ncbi:MAG: DegT/DnrJ/EryC1/StrS family aminotransferase [Ignavibacteriales bacterium]|nr:DegT/DnrJ/EryC1/StrS family aminotransferase [Ignavibacteriales bacterium]MCF8305684.1 DegT/DnrJ/EryC1/StrS family aminotransferase [Ignavibacteriales bacterium]MCF8315406.1 DegT/DnrJ/EryC1/StrS family aminotransferase [Ignavibacteriales bacterium]MCF8436702.1 DegT/DnrJ/EryC1/StrS family aminotransferase [Ignavibacteriales bacterium]